MMNNTRYPLKLLLLAALTASLSLTTGLAAQNAPSPTQPAAAQSDNDTTRAELARFDDFLDSHPETAEQLRKNPSLVNNEEFVEKHPQLQEYLQQHPGVREELSENPNRFMAQERRFDRRETGQENEENARKLRNFDGFLDSHPEIAEQLRKDPSLVNDKGFVKKHDALEEYLEQNPGVREELKENPNAFLRQEQRFDRRETGQENEENVRKLRNFDGFLDSHPEIAEQLRKNPSLVDDKGFVKKHEALGDFLEQNPGVREELKENPNAFMQQERRFDRREDSMDRDTTRGSLAGFDQFLDSHSEIAEQLRKDPSLLRNEEFAEKHPALKDYLQQHPGVREEISENPNSFMRQEQRFDRREDAMDRDRGPSPIAGFGEFLGNHAKIAQQLSKDPSLAHNEEYVENHPELQAFLQAHPDLQEQLKQHPEVVMQSVQQQNNNNVTNKTNVAKKPARTGSTEPKH